MSAVDVQAAYRHCEGVTRSRARNFYYGIRLLPPAKRSALCAVYAFARRVDDIGDAPQHFPLPLKAFGELIEGVEMDVRGTSYPTFDDLAHYCRCVAGSIGRLSLGVFGSAEQHAAPVLADKLGIAMQLTNILRDLREDADNGRVYLPKEDLVRFGLDGELTALESVTRAPDGFTRLVGFQVARAQRFFAEGLCLLPMLDRRSAACVSAMSGIYRELLGRIARRPEAVLHQRVSLPTWRKARIAARSLLGMSS